jgi:hypothetical protein
MVRTVEDAPSCFSLTTVALHTAEEITVVDQFDKNGSEVVLLGTGIGGTEGRLRLDGTRLVFSDRADKIMFSHEVASLHSVSTRGTQMHVWQGDTVHRFLFDIGESVETHTGTLMTLLTLSSAKDSTRWAGQEVDRWSALLRPLAGSAPTGFVPPRKMSEAKVAVILVGVLLAIPAIGVAIYAIVTS